MIELQLARHASPCVRSGLCCKKAACGFGERTSEDDPACKFLEGEGPGEYFCGIAEEIVKDPSWEISPAFGAGCCMALFNDAREQVLRERRASGGRRHSRHP